MAERFNFDKFDKLCADALEEDKRMAEEDEAWEQYERWLGYDQPLPGQIGGVACRPSVVTEADITIEGSPDVVVYDPNQGSLWD